MTRALTFLKRSPAFVACLLVALQSTHSVAAITTLEPIADAYVVDGSWANTNFGTDTWLFTKTDNTAKLENYDSYLKFDLSTVSSVASAKLRLNSASGSESIGATLYAVSNTTWSETGITWNNKPARGGALGSITVSGSTFIYREIDVSSYVRGEKAAGRNLVSFGLHNPLVSTGFIWIRSRQATTNHPQLVITPNEAPTVSLTSPANGATFTAPANVTLTASAADTDGTIQKVEFFHGGTNLIATVTTAPYTFNWTNVAAASYTLTAKATDNLNAATTSAPVNITVNAAVAQLFFIHTDHLNTPRLVANATGTTVWRWDPQEPFGVNVPDENPSGVGAFEFVMRLPGQYFDKETNLHYNRYRDYDPGIGRYVQSDPIGLRGGINTYAYVEGSPVALSDVLGLDPERCLGCLAYAEAGGTSDACRRAVIWSIRNRTYDPRNFPGQSDECVAAAAPRQFDAYRTRRYRDCINDCLIGPEKRAGDSTFVLSLELIQDPTGGATYFHDNSITTPTWIRNRMRNGNMRQIQIPGCNAFQFYGIN